MGEKRRLELRIPLTLHKKLVSRAEYQGKTINALCLDIFWDYFENREGQNEKTKYEEEKQSS